MHFGVNVGRRETRKPRKDSRKKIRGDSGRKTLTVDDRSRLPSFYTHTQRQNAASHQGNETEQEKNNECKCHRVNFFLKKKVHDKFIKEDTFGNQPGSNDVISYIHIKY